MKSLRISIALALVMALSVLTGCRKHYINGDLDGQWQILTIEYVSAHLRQVFATPGAVLGNMKYDKSTLSLDFPTVENTSDLSAWGMNAVSTTFTVKHLSHEKLVMESDYAVISCRKF